MQRDSSVSSVTSQASPFISNPFVSEGFSSSPMGFTSLPDLLRHEEDFPLVDELAFLHVDSGDLSSHLGL